MLPDEGNQAHLWDMLQYARGVVAASAGRNWDNYQADEDFRLAIERRIEIIGEAAGRLSAEFRAAHPDIPWRSIVAQRNVLAHMLMGKSKMNEFGNLWRRISLH